MKPVLFLIAAAASVALSACEAATPAERAPLEMKTIEETPPRLAAVDPPPLLQTGIIPPTATAPPPEETKAPSREPTAAEALKAKTSLPFAPHIAMDPVDGSKLTITIDTPVFLYKDRWYYFSSEGNRRAFRANPAQYLTGPFARY
ncbi:MAG: YHS domain-containing protein [Thermoanaerobaculia bacterium]